MKEKPSDEFKSFKHPTSKEMELVDTDFLIASYVLNSSDMTEDVNPPSGENIENR